MLKEITVSMTASPVFVIMNMMMPTEDEKNDMINNRVTGSVEKASTVEAMNDPTESEKATHKSAFPERAPFLIVIGYGLSLVALLLASIALLCLSSNILFKAIMTGPSFAIAPNTAAMDAITAAAAVMICAVSLMMFYRRES
jgi:hypothetical protein